MARQVIPITLEVESKTGEVSLIRRYSVEKKRSPGEHYPRLERELLGFLVPPQRTPRQNEETLHAILLNMLGKIRR